MERIRAFFGEKAEIIASFKKAGQSDGPGIPAAVEAAILATAGRRPVTAADLSRSLGVPAASDPDFLAPLRLAGKARPLRPARRRIYYEG